MIWEAHYSRVAIYFGTEKTVAVLQKYFYWLKFLQYVGRYIRSCTSYAIIKPSVKKQRLHTPLPTPNESWESICMEYISGLPSTKHGNDCVFVFMDHFSNMDIMIAYKSLPKSLLSSSSSMFVFTLASRRPLLQIEIVYL